MSRLGEWAEFYFNKIRPYIPVLITQMKRQNLEKGQARAIIKEVFNLAIEEFDKKFT